MVLTKEELLGSLHNEVRILLHLAGKVDKSSVDYRPTPKQRSTLELLRYMTYMGPTLIRLIQAGDFAQGAVGAAFSQAEAAAKDLTFDQAVAALRNQSDEYTRLLAAWSDSDYRRKIDLFGVNSTIGAMLVSIVLGGHAAYRTQLFCYLKSCGRDELNTMNLWAGQDGAMAAG